MPLPKVSPIVQPHGLLRPITSGLRSLIRPPLHTLPALPHMPMTNILRSVLHPNLHSYIDKLHSMPHTLAKAASLPLQNLLRAQLQLHQILLPTLSPTSLNNAKPGTIPTTDLTHLVGHYSPVVGAPPTSFKSTPTVVDSPQQEDPTSMDKNSNTEENIVSSAKNEKKDANKNEKDGVQNEENNCN
ncbi:uncharacterized protein LOC143347135 [Colletes latitarsis]|uniref:uncharacterized protein LOC143347135 n=1 Tax=Colletes latitarsis TaxID=2605962 RepID=UPI0040365529